MHMNNVCCSTAIRLCIVYDHFCAVVMELPETM